MLEAAVSEILFYGGLAAMGAAAAAAVAAVLLFHRSGKRLAERLEEEFGKKRR
ncbi:hypothetical protein [Clostridium sp. D33t1_170424_F3]|uniref:hypothetical protein n=1 Tax=Clostridium sp. D33t1_170424_F3 TaxID=2787099 RepID=UPI0018ABDC43|nr:hypothetical protein [Clostridium sp. D33t1_170424_F3]